MASSDAWTKKRVENAGFVWIEGEPITEAVKNRIRRQEQIKGTSSKSTVSVPKAKPTPPSDEMAKTVKFVKGVQKSLGSRRSAPPLPKPKPKPKRTIESVIKELGLDKPSRKPVSAPKPKPQQGLKRRQSNIDKEDRKTSLSAARRAGHLYYWKNGKKMAAVTREDLKESGLGLTAFMNMQLGKTARKPKKAPAKVKTKGKK